MPARRPRERRTWRSSTSDDRRRGRFLVVVGVVLALVAGGAAFFLITQAQQQAGQAGLPMTRVVVAAKAIAARAPITAGDVTSKEVPLDPTNANGRRHRRRTQVIGRVPAVTILQGQLVTTNMLASTTEGGQFSILRPDETIAPDSEAWRAVSITVPDDLAVGGMLTAGQTVDVFVTAVVSVPHELVASGKLRVRPLDEGHLPGHPDPRPRGRLLRDPRGARRSPRRSPTSRPAGRPRSAWRSDPTRTGARSTRPTSARRRTRSSTSTACRSPSPSSRHGNASRGTTLPVADADAAPTPTPTLTPAPSATPAP